MAATVNFKLDISQLDAMREIISRDEKNDQPVWDRWQKSEEQSGERIHALRELQRHQFQRDKLRRALGIE